VEDMEKKEMAEDMEKKKMVNWSSTEKEVEGMEGVI
jgi:hypothetical protein